MVWAQAYYPNLLQAGILHPPFVPFGEEHQREARLFIRMGGGVAGANLTLSLGNGEPIVSGVSF